MTENRLIVPTVHLNGTSKETLMDQITDAAQALRLAMEAIREAAPNARDYYVQGPNAFQEVQRQHCARINRLADVYTEYMEIAEAIADQGKNRQR
jgi:hypothetical protein